MAGQHTVWPGRFPWQSIPWLILILGLSLRIVVWGQNRSLFLDEANLARNIAERDIPGFFHPLDHQQYAPPLFLVVEKISCQAWGNHEYALRLWPLLMGCLSLVFLFRVMCHWRVGTAVTTLGLWLIGLSPVFIRYSSEVKQYSTDVACSLALVLLYVCHPPESSKGRWWLWALGGALVIWLSMPSVFVLTGLGLALLWRQFSRKDFRAVRTTLLSVAVWLTSFAVYFLLILRFDLEKNALIDYHREYFFPLVPQTAEAWQDAWAIIRSLFRAATGHTFVSLAAGLIFFLFGSFYLWQERRDHFWLLLAPLSACLLASGFRLYSMMERLSLFLIPLIVLVIMFGVHHFHRRWPSGGWILATVWLVVGTGREGWRFFREPLEISEIRPAIEYLRDHAKEGDFIWVDHNTSPALLFYENWHDRRQDYSLENVHLASWDELPGHAANRWENTPRIWLLYSHLVSDHNRNELQTDLGSLSHYEIAMKYEPTGAAVFLLLSKNGE